MPLGERGIGETYSSGEARGQHPDRKVGIMGEKGNADDAQRREKILGQGEVKGGVVQVDGMGMRRKEREESMEFEDDGRKRNFLARAMSVRRPGIPDPGKERTAQPERVRARELRQHPVDPGVAPSAVQRRR